VFIQIALAFDFLIQHAVRIQIRPSPVTHHLTISTASRAWSSL